MAPALCTTASRFVPRLLVSGVQMALIGSTHTGVSGLTFDPGLLGDSTPLSSHPWVPTFVLVCPLASGLPEILS